MELLNLEQGSKEWLEARKSCLTASEAPVIMGASKYKSRNALLDEKYTGITPKVSPAQQKIFDKGHETEDKARIILETEYVEDFLPLVGVVEIDGIKVLASFDGITEDRSLVFEHKLYNEGLAEKRSSWCIRAALLLAVRSAIISKRSGASYLYRIGRHKRKPRSSFLYFRSRA